MSLPVQILCFIAGFALLAWARGRITLHRLANEIEKLEIRRNLLEKRYREAKNGNTPEQRLLALRNSYLFSKRPLEEAKERYQERSRWFYRIRSKRAS